MDNPNQHYPNPFDFVPFAEHPLTKKEADFDGMGELMSGYLEVQIKALTPVHVVGYQEHVEEGRYSAHYRQNERACIPAASIRGCLRSFVEALTAGWVSQVTPEYEKEFRKRHLGYATFYRKQTHKLGPAINTEYKPKATPDAILDVASYLFGLVLEKEKEGSASHEDLARKSRVWIEDVYIPAGQMDKTRYWLPDISGEAFMGGAKPTASNWWYMQPLKVWQRDTNINGQIRPMAEFIGEKYWGRKFYFHQNPEQCVTYYEPRNRNWVYRDVNPFCKVVLECLKPQAFTDTFRIYVDRVPRQLLILLILSLSPGKNIRHKLGYGKAYGFGSIEFLIKGAYLRPEDTANRIPLPLQNALNDIEVWKAFAWDRDQLQKEQLDTLIDWRALQYLALILGWGNSERLKFTYPPFKPGYFARGISKNDFNQAVQSSYKLGQPISSPQEGVNIADKLFNTKKPIHFRLYQEKSNGWNLIRNRKP